MTTVIVTGLAVGSIYAIIALGYCIIHLASGVLNFAQAHAMVLGMFISVWAIDRGASLLVAVAASAVGVTAFSLLVERVAIRPLRSHESHAELVTTLGVATMVTGGLVIVAGTDPWPVHLGLSTTPMDVLGGRVAPVDLALIGAAVATTALLALVVHRTRFGIASLAKSENAEAAALRGVDLKRLSIIGFCVAGAIAGLLGPLTGAKTYAVATIGLLFAVKGFVAMSLGGVGSILGALVGGLSIGLLESFTTRYLGSDFRDIAVFVVFLLIMVARPHGLFKTRHLRTV